MHVHAALLPLGHDLTFSALPVRNGKQSNAVFVCEAANEEGAIFARFLSSRMLQQHIKSDGLVCHIQ